tara:strand:+ start:1177 stop:1941 length:765 start_codon:yes stop_codon:yes gene_type:complete
MQKNIIILAAGLGKRMKSNNPKVLHLFNNKPFLVKIIEESKKIENHNILVVVGKYKNMIKKLLDNFNCSNNITFIKQIPALGTGHAVQCCIPYLNSNLNPNSKTVVLYGDTPLITSETIKKMFLVDKVKCIVTKKENPFGLGRIIIKDNGIVKIVEEKDCTDEERKITLVNCGIYCFDTKLLIKYLPLLSNNNKQQEYYLTDIIEIIKNSEHCEIESHIVSKEYQHEVFGVNTPEELENLENLHNSFVESQSNN